MKKHHLLRELRSMCEGAGKDFTPGNAGRVVAAFVEAEDAGSENRRARRFVKIGKARVICLIDGYPVFETGVRLADEDAKTVAGELGIKLDGPHTRQGDSENYLGD